VKIDVETKPVTITTRVFTLEITEEEWNALKYAVVRGADGYAARRAIRGQTAPTDQLRKLQKDMEAIDDVEKSARKVRIVEPEEDDEEFEGDEDDFDEED
jgi:hypothetical protein